MKTVLLPEPIRPEGRRLLEGRVRIVEAPDHGPETLKKFIRDAHGVILRTGARITAEIIAKAPQLQVIARTGAGVDNVDVKAATERKIPVCYVPDANVVSVAEHVMSLLLALSKQLKVLDEEVHRGNFSVRYQYLSTELWGKTLGIIGLGKIGREVAQRARKGFAMKVVTFDPYVSPEEARHLGAEPFDSLTKMLSQSDAVTLHVPLTDETRNLMGPGEFRSMKPSSWFINTSRGGLVDEAALIEALDSGVIAGAGLDVFESEPLDPDSPLTKFSNVILTPHVAGLTNESSIRMAVGAAEAVLDVLEGRTPAHVFNRKQLKEAKG
jgi:D-3-phosphoglycerate dehydrogenase